MDKLATILCQSDTSFVEIWRKATMNFLISTERWLDGNVSHEALIAIPALFVALLIPVIFFLVERDDLYGFDKNVILNRIILYKVSIPLIIITSVVLFFKIIILSVLFCLALLVVLCIVMYRTYMWMSSIEKIQHKNTYKQTLRLRYISGIKNETEKIDTWALILNDEKLLEKNQRGLVDEFLKTANSTDDTKKSRSKSNLLALMSRNVSKVDFSDITAFEKLVSYSIEYYGLMTDIRGKRKNGGDKTLLQYPPYHQRELAENLLKIALDKNISDILDYCYFKMVKEHVAKSGIDEGRFIGEFLPTYIRTVKDNDEYKADDLWENELSDWVITSDLLKSEASLPKAINLLNSYMKTVGQYARTDTDLSQHEVDVINDITSRMLPEINQSFWFDFVTLYNSGWGVDDGEDSTHAQIRNHLSKHRNFGLFNSIELDGWIEDEKARLKAYDEAFAKQDEETMFILGLVYKFLRNPRYLKEVLDQIYIIEGEKLFKEDSYEARQLDVIKSRFEKLRDYTNKMISEQDKKSNKSK